MSVNKYFFHFFWPLLTVKWCSKFEKENKSNDGTASDCVVCRVENTVVDVVKNSDNISVFAGWEFGSNRWFVKWNVCNFVLSWCTANFPKISIECLNEPDSVTKEWTPIQPFHVGAIVDVWEAQNFGVRSRMSFTVDFKKHLEFDGTEFLTYLSNFHRTN